MKIKFTKDFKYPGFDISAGAVKDLENYGFKDKVKEWFQWLIDNGFAEATVRQDEGVLTLDDLKHYRAENIFAYGIGVDSFSKCLIEVYEMLPLAGGIYFKSWDYARASLNKHPDEWKIIANYDWSRE